MERVIQKKRTTPMFAADSKPVGSIAHIGTTNTYSTLYILKKILSIERNEYMVAYADDKTKRTTTMKLPSKTIQKIVGPIPAHTLVSYNIPA